jgi:outer membrane autotransporter protein
VLSQLSGDVYPSTTSALVEEDRLVRNTMLDRATRAAEDVTLWATGFASFGSLSSMGNAAPIDARSAGGMAGVDVPLGDGFQAGIAGGYTQDRAATDDRSARADGHATHVAGYLAWTAGDLAVNLGGAYGWGDGRVTRTIAGFPETDTASRSTTTAQAFGDIGYRFALGNGSIAPYAGVNWVSIDSGSFAETGGVARLDGGAVSDDMVFSSLGARFTGDDLDLLDGVGLVPKADVAWQHAFDTFRPIQRLTFASTGQDFTVAGTPLGIDTLAVQAGFDVEVSSQLRLSVAYDGAFSNTLRDDAVRASLAWRF